MVLLIGLYSSYAKLLYLEDFTIFYIAEDFENPNMWNLVIGNIQQQNTGVYDTVLQVFVDDSISVRQKSLASKILQSIYEYIQNIVLF